MLTVEKSDPVFAETASEIYQVSADEHERQLMEAREDALRNERDMQFFLEQAVAERDKAILERDSAVSERNSAVSERDHLQALLATYEAKFGPLDEK